MAQLFNIKGYPFAKLSAEEERPYIKDIFYKQQYYNSLLSIAEEGVSRFVLGQRGQGKSATILHLFEDMRELSVLPILIDNYKGFPLDNNENHFLYNIIQSLTFSIAEHLLKNRKDYKKLSAENKEQLAFFIEAFYDQQCATECEYCAKNIQSKKIRNKVKRWLNNHLKILNNIIGVGVKCGTELIRSYSGVDVDYSSVGAEYISEFSIETFNRISIDDMTTWDTNKLLKIITNLKGIANKVGYKSVVIMLDKIDEVHNINADIEKITNFIIEVLTDTNLLYSDGISIVVSLWSEIKSSLNNKGVRFDKFKEVDIRWRNDELEALLNKRLLYFSIDRKSPVSLETLVPKEQNRNLILELADHSPRSLLDLLGRILSEEQTTEQLKTFSDDAISKGAINFCKKFDYVSAQPSRTGQDLSSWISRLLSTKRSLFSLTEYSNSQDIGTKQGAKHIQTLLKYNLIKDAIRTTNNGETIYEIVDPRIKHLISRGEVGLNN